MAARPSRDATASKAATVLYGTIDADAAFYRCPVEKGSRSVMNVVFRLPSEDLEKRFVDEARKAAMVGLKGHRSVGGIRVSLYNAVEPAWVTALAGFMKDFRTRSALTFSKAHAGRHGTAAPARRFASPP